MTQQTVHYATRGIVRMDRDARRNGVIKVVDYGGGALLVFLPDDGTDGVTIALAGKDFHHNHTMSGDHVIFGGCPTWGFLTADRKLADTIARLVGGAV